MRRLVFLDALKAIAIVCVVAVHAMTHVQLDNQSRQVLMFLFGTIAVPLFFLTDGFLFSGKWTEKEDFNYTHFVKRSATRLLVPWALITLLYALARLGLEWMSVHQETILMGTNLQGVAKVIYLSELAQQLYFLLSLFVVRLTSLGIVRLLRSSRWVWLTVLTSYVVLYVLCNPKEWFLPGSDPLLLALWGGQFYLLGIVLQKWHETLVPVAGTVGTLCLLISFSAALLLHRLALPLTQLIYLVGSYAMIVALTKRTEWGFALGRDTMGIYLLHAPYVLWAVATFVALVLPTRSVSTFLCVTVAAVLVSWGITRLVRMTVIGRVLLGESTL